MKYINPAQRGYLYLAKIRMWLPEYGPESTCYISLRKGRGTIQKTTFSMYVPMT